MHIEKDSYEDFVEKRKTELIKNLKKNKQNIEQVAFAYGVPVCVVKNWLSAFNNERKEVKHVKR